MGRLQLLSSVSCLSSFRCYFCILYFSLLPFLMCLRIQFYFLLFFIFSSYLFLFHSSMRSLIIFVFFFVHHLKKLLSTCASDSCIVHYIPTPCILSLFVHPIFSCIYSLFFLFYVHPFCVYSLLHFL